MEKLTPQQALDILIAASKLASMPFNQHVLCGNASKVLTEALNNKQEM